MENVEFASVHKLATVVKYCEEIENNSFSAYARVRFFTEVYLRYEKIMIDRNLDTSPIQLVDNYIDSAFLSLKNWIECSYAGDQHGGFEDFRPDMEDMHEELFQDIWSTYDIETYKNDRIARYIERIRINDLTQLIEGKDVIDFGCGHGSFGHALVHEGAGSYLGVDFGEGNIDFAKRMTEVLKGDSDRIRFKLATVYETHEPDEAYDFAINNGVFHHLDNENKAYAEVYRVLKPGGWFWVYTDGGGGISHQLFDAARVSLANVPQDFVLGAIRATGLSVEKAYHLCDSFNAVYRHTSFGELSARLSSMGFGEISRKVGGYPTDFDHDVIACDRHGEMKFGDGDIRLVCKKL
jgi:ubiquinone/menaquinone biosynthesis C-methylase UbiE